MADWFVGAIIAIVGWVVSVEYRLGVIFGLTSKVDHIQSQVDLLVGHLLGQNKRPPSGTDKEI